MVIRDFNNASTVKWVQKTGGGCEEKLQVGEKAGWYTLLSGARHKVSAAPRGFACKLAKRTNRVYTKQQIDFVEWAYMEGVKGPHGGHAGKKYTADRAASDMQAFGTTAGEAQHPGVEFWKLPPVGAPSRKFDRRELLDAHCFRSSWFSKPLPAFSTAIANARKKQVASTIDLVASNAVVGGDDGEEM